MTIGDIEAAFLRGDEMKREKGRVLVKLPKDGIPGVPDGSIIELHKPSLRTGRRTKGCGGNP